MFSKSQQYSIFSTIKCINHLRENDSFNDDMQGNAQQNSAQVYSERLAVVNR
jgi:hypothetical protein